MIYEVRTYTLRPGTLAEFEERYQRRLPSRERHSKLGAFCPSAHEISICPGGPFSRCSHDAPGRSLGYAECL